VAFSWIFQSMTKPKSFLNALKWSYTATWGQQGFSALFTVILGGLLGPRDFGMVSIALVYVAFLQMFLDQGFVTALIQKKDLEQEHLDAVFWMNQVLSLFLVGVSILLSGWWARKNHAPEVATLISALSLCIPLQGLASVHSALLNRRMDFKSLSIRSNVAVLLSGFVGIGMALAGFRAWALVAQQITRDSIAAVLLWKLSEWRPRFEFSWKHLAELTSFSFSNFLALLGIFADVQSASVLVGLMFGPIAVGLYRMAERVANGTQAAVTSSIQAVSLPEFSRVQDNPLELRKSGLACIRMCSASALPAFAGLAAVSGPLMATVGPKWIPASNALTILCVLNMALVFAYFTGPLLQALSRPHQLAILEWIRMGVGAVFLVVAGFFVRNAPVEAQVAGIAVARFVTGTFLVTPAFLYIFMRLCRISIRDLLLTVLPSGIASLSVVASVTLFRMSGWLANDRPVILLGAEVVIGGATGLTVLFKLDRELRSLAASLLQSVVARHLHSRNLA
jgi:O-antigen/teichoic acid export membrane protein